MRNIGPCRISAARPAVTPSGGANGKTGTEEPLRKEGVTLTVTATAVGGNSYGIIVLDGAIKEFSIGGQELWLDDICPTK